MKMTVEVSDALFLKAKGVCKQKGISMRSLVEQGLHEVLQEDRDRPKFKLRDLSVTRDGLVSGVTDKDLLSLAYEKRTF